MPDLTLSLSNGTITSTARTNIRSLVDPHAPRYRLPRQVQYNPVTKRCELRPEDATRIDYFTHRPTNVVDVLSTSDNEAQNRLNLIAAFTAVLAANGTANVHNLRRIRLNPLHRWGTAYPVLDIALFDDNGITTWLYLETTVANTSALRAQGQRAGLDDYAALGVLPKFGLTTFNTPTFDLAGSCRRIRFVGLAFDIHPDSLAALRTGPYSRTGDVGGDPFSQAGHVRYEHDAFDSEKTGPNIDYRRTRKPDTPTDIIFDRCVLLGDDDVRMRRLIRADINRLVLRDCYLENPGDTGTRPDSQAVTVLAVDGDHIFLNCGIANAHGEHVSYGGGLTHAPRYANRDLVFIGCDFFFLARWGPATASNPGGRNFVTKNFWECKVADGVLIEGCTFRDYYGFLRQGQQAFVIVLKASDQLLNEVWVRSRDVTIRLCLFDRVSGGLSVVGGDRFLPNAGYQAAEFKAIHRIEFSFNAFLPWDMSTLGLGRVGFKATSIAFSARSSGDTQEDTGTYQGDDERFLVTDVSIRYNTLWGANRPDDPDPENPDPSAYNPLFLVDASYCTTPHLKRWDVSRNIFTGPNIYPGWTMMFLARNAATQLPLPGGWTRMTRTDTAFTYYLMAGYSSATNVNSTIGSTNVVVGPPASLNLSATLVPQPGSPAIGMGELGLNVGCDWTLLASATATCITGRN